MLWLAVLSVSLPKLGVVAPPLVDSVPVPSVVRPSLKVTVPLGLTAAALPGELTLTVAVKVTDWPETEGLAEGTTVVVVAALLTTWISDAQVGVQFTSTPWMPA